MILDDVSNVSTDIDKCVSVGDSYLIDSPEQCSSLLRDTATDLKIIVQNIRSLNCNFDDFSVHLSRLNVTFDIIILTECWLHHTTNFPSMTNYICYATTKHKNQNSGIVVYIRNSLDANVSEPNVEDSDSLLIKIGRRFAIVALYRSPSIYNVDSFQQSLGTLLNKLKSYKFVVVTGDMNLNIKEGNNDPRTAEYLNELAVNGLLPSHLLPTRESKCLDHCFLKLGCKATTIVCNSTITDHSSLIISIKTKHIITQAKTKVLSKLDYDMALQELKQTDWSVVTNCHDADLATQNLLTIITGIIDKCTSTRKINNRKAVKKPWITPGLIRCIRWRDNLHNKLKKDPDNIVKRVTYKRYRNHCNRLLNNLKIQYEKTELNKNRNNIKNTWKILRQICHLQTDTKHPVELLAIKNNPKTSVNHVNQLFADVGKSLANNILNKNKTTESDLLNKITMSHNMLNSMVLLPTDVHEITKIVMSLKSTSSSGWDKVSSNFIKLGIKYLAKPISHVCNICFDTGTFPKLLKQSIITPIFKSGDRNSVNNYRPISILPTIAKIIEKSINSRLVGYLEANSFLSPNQYGFRQHKSTTNAIEEVVQFITDTLDTRCKCLALFLDLSKAFDTVSIPILLRKMECAGIRGLPLQLFTSYLNDRRQSVKIDGLQSDYTETTYGVPQGSVLGPTLFLIYMNDLTRLVIDGRIVSFADDTVLLFKAPTWEEIKKRSEHGLGIVLTWLDQNVLTLNFDKTKYITFSIYNNHQPSNLNLKAHVCNINTDQCNCTTLASVANIKYLGVTLDQNLNWKSQIENLSNRMRKVICIFKKLRHIREWETIKLAYYALSQSILQYGINTWGAAKKTHLIQVERSQRAILKIATFKDFRHPTTQLYKELEILTVRQLFIKSTILRQHRIIPPEFEMKRRIPDIYPKPTCKTKFGHNSPSYLGPHLYNKLSKDIKSLKTLSSYGCKNIVTKYLLKLDYVATEELMS